MKLLIRILGALLLETAAALGAPKRPNVIVVIADQWRAQAFGFAGNADVKTPHLDALAAQSSRFLNAVSTIPVCSPMRASFLSGQRALSHGVFLNDVPLSPNASSIAKVFAKQNYDTGYIGKWHVNGDGRSAFIPRERRQGFDYWKVLECTHDYNHSEYYADGPEKLVWPGYDAIAQTHDAERFIEFRNGNRKPFFLVLAWGPPHNPYFTAPGKYRAMYDENKIHLRPNVPNSAAAKARHELAGYFAHCSALDDCVGDLITAMEAAGIEENTILVITSDHGDMLGSHGLERKQWPYDESVRVPLLIHWPAKLGRRGADISTPICTEDLMPTLLGLSDISSPRSVQGRDLSSCVSGRKKLSDPVLISCVTPFSESGRRAGGREYRGFRDVRYTYCRDLSGPWLLFDNNSDPFQTNNLVANPGASKWVKKMDGTLSKLLKQQHDEFLPAPDYIARFGYHVDANGAVPYTK
jgi:arylsulfatase A-like enzyme